MTRQSAKFMSIRDTIAAMSAGFIAFGLAMPMAHADAWSETFASCKLQTVSSEKLSIEAYACGPDFGNVHLESEASLPGFVIVSDGPDGVSREVAIRAFAKAAEDPIDAILPAVRAVSPGPHTETCTLQSTPGGEASEQRFALSPTGAAKTAWDKGVEAGEPIDPPCGPLGVQFTGDLYFAPVANDAATVVFINGGSEIQIFKPHTLKPKSGG